MPILDFFDCAYYINLDKREDRRKHMERTLSDMKIDAERFSAFECKGGIQSEWGFIDKRLSGVYGCLQSHLKLLEKVYEKNVSNVLILEDDIAPSPFWCCHRVFLDQLKHMDWSFFYFYSKENEAGKKVGLFDSLNEAPWQTYAYAVNKHAIPKAIKLIKASKGPVIYPIDGLYAMNIKEKVFVPRVNLINHCECLVSNIR